MAWLKQPMCEIKAWKKEMRRLDRKIRTALVERILANASPYFHESGFIKSALSEPTEYTRLVPLPRTYKLDSGVEVEAITEDGIVSDSYCAAVMMGFEELSIDALEKLVQISEKLCGQCTPIAAPLIVDNNTTPTSERNGG